MAQKFDSRQIISHDVLANVLGVDGSQLKTLLQNLNKEINAPYRISATSPTADSKINFQASEVEAADLAAKNASPVSSQIPTFPASTIDFQSGATTGGTFNISFPNSTVGYFRRIGFSLDASGTIQCLFSAEVASLGSLANAGTVFVKGALPIGWIDLEATAASPGRFKTAGSATNIIENKVGSSNRVHRIVGGGGASSGSGSGTGDDINALTFKASFTDLFADLPTDSVSAVDYTTGKTDSTTYDIVSSYHRLAYDASKTVTGSGVNMTLSSAPAFTIKAGDVLVVGTEVKKIASITSQTVFAVESAFTTTPSSSACCVSQAVHTKDLNNFAGDGLAVSTAFSTSISQILMTYEDTSTLSDTIFDANTSPVIAYSASSDGTNFSALSLRPTNLSDMQSMLNLPTSGTNLYVRFFANKSSGSGSVNILGYKTFFHRDASFSDGSVLNQAYGRLDNTGTKINVAAIANVAGKTRIQLSWSYPVGVNSGTANGSLKVLVDGLKLPRFVDSTVSISGYYKEIDQNTIELDADYSLSPIEFEIVQDVAVVDASDTNTTAVAQIQEAIGEGFQAFVKSSQVINATTGTPGTGQFYSTIANRAAISDLSQDLKVRMGIERIMTQQIYQLQNEFGPNGEPVFSVVNDDRGQIRFVGSGIFTINDASGQRIGTGTTSTDYAEVTFYGTGINLLQNIGVAANVSVAYSVDGGAESTTATTSYSGVITGRNYSTNSIIPIVSGLTLGVHTVKIRAASSSGVGYYGFEVLNEASTLKVNPGSSYINSKKITTNAQQTVVYNSTFESGTLGTRGGRVLVYQKSDGTIAKAVTPAGSQLNLTSADHTNEEIARVYSVKEFGAGRSDDFSIATAAGSYTFTLDDGTTTLSGAAVVPNTLFSGRTGVGYSTSGFLILTFVGTGLDINCNSTSANTIVTLVDGASVGNITTLTTGYRTYKVVSGLPYGTHTVKLTIATATNITINEFIAYQPKKPTLPSGAVELADYNVMANYAVGTSFLIEAIGTGLLRKNALRELVYGGTGWALGTPTSAYMNYLFVQTTTIGDYAQYTFFGTGFEFRFDLLTNNATAVQLTLDGSITNFSAYTTSVYGTGVAFTASTGILNQGSAISGGAGGLSISNLPLGLHTIKIAYSSGGAAMRIGAVDVITPIHSAKSNLYADLQNTLPVGSQGISDNRKTSAIKEALPAQKAWAQAVGISANPTMAATAAVPIPDMSVTIKTNGGILDISFQMAVFGNSNSGDRFYSIYVDGVLAYETADSVETSAGDRPWVHLRYLVPVSAGTHKVEAYWRSSGVATLTGQGTGRILIAKEL